MWSERDRYGRVVGRVFVDGLDVNAEMVRQGHAWVYRQYAKDESLFTLENEARAAMRGLWALSEADTITAPFRSLMDRSHSVRRNLKK